MTIKSWMRGLLLVAATSAVASGGGPRGIGALVNGDFDNDLSGWTNLYSRPAVWDPLDADGDPASGSVLVGNDSAVGNGGTRLVLGQCLPVGGGATVAYGGHILLPTGQPDWTSAAVVVWSFASDNCSLDLLDSYAANIYEPGVDWQAVQGEATLSAQARSVMLLIGVSKAQGVIIETSGYFNRLYMVIAGDGIFANGFEP